MTRTKGSAASARGAVLLDVLISTTLAATLAIVLVAVLRNARAIDSKMGATLDDALRMQRAVDALEADLRSTRAFLGDPRDDLASGALALAVQIRSPELLSDGAGEVRYYWDAADGWLKRATLTNAGDEEIDELMPSEPVTFELVAARGGSRDAAGLADDAAGGADEPIERVGIGVGVDAGVEERVTGADSELFVEAVRISIASQDRPDAAGTLADESVITIPLPVARPLRPAFGAVPGAPLR